MDYHIVVVQKAVDEIHRTVGWYYKQSPAVANRWYEALMATIDTLGNSPERCPIVRNLSIGRKPIRQLLFGKKHGQYRILFEIKEKTVYVRRVVHHAQEKP